MYPDSNSRWLEKTLQSFVELKFKLPGAPAFLMTNSSQRKEALIRFIFVVFFSLSPFILIVVLDFISMDNQNILISISKYTNAGQIYFLIGAILGAAFILVRDNFREDHRNSNVNSLTNGEMRMRTERTWFSLYLHVISIVSVVILCTYHLKQDKNDQLIYWSSSIIYFISLYVWYVDILYSRIGIDDEKFSEDEPTPHNNDGKDKMNSSIEDALSGMSKGGGV